MEASVTSDYIRISLWSTAIAFWLYWLWTRRDLYKFSLKFPRYWGLPFVGIMGCYLRSKYDFLPTFGKLLEKSENTVCIWFGVTLGLLTSEPELIEKVLTSPNLINKSNNIYKPLGKALGDGLITEPANKWRRHRKLINPAFQHKVLLTLFPFFEEGKQNLISKFDSMDDNQEHSIFDLIESTTFGITFKTTMGTEIECNDKASDFLYCFKYLVDELMIHIFLEIFGVGWLYNLNMRYRRIRNRLWQFDKEILNSKLESKMIELESNINRKMEDKLDESDCESIKKVPNIFIDQAVQIFRKQQIEYDDVINETNQIVVAALETTANTIYSAIVLLAMHLHAQERLFEEICSVFPDKDFQMNYEQMQHLPYFDMVLNEVLRLVPPVPIIARQVVEDTQIDKDLTLPKDMQIFMSVFHLHRRKDIWGPDADQFDPDHFLPKNMIGKHSYSFIPFSKGARNCIGWRYALFSMKIILVGLLRNFKFSTDFKYENLEFIENVTILFKEYPNIRIQRR